MTEADPTNELGFFSLGRAYIDGDQPKEAIPALQQRPRPQPQLLQGLFASGSLAQKASGDQPGARRNPSPAATKSRMIAATSCPATTLAAMLQGNGLAPVPGNQRPNRPTPEDTASGKIRVLALRPYRARALKMPAPPFSSANSASGFTTPSAASCFREWIGQGTKVINELAG